jgi:small ligand-binding sensory domain FIST
MPFASTLSLASQTEQALNEACTRGLEQLGETPDLAFVFFSMEHAGNAGQIAKQVQERLRTRCLLGCTGEAIVSNDREIEQGAALSLWLAHWRRPIELIPCRFRLEKTADGFSLLGWPDALMSADRAQSTLLLLADPFTFPIDAFLQQANNEFRGVQVMGGMASGGRTQGNAHLIIGSEDLTDGAVGVLLQGETGIRSVVSQGCRPIGQHMVITRGRENVIEELGGQTPLVRLQQIWQHLNPRDQQLFQEGLHIGRVINEYRDKFQRGDFLVRNVIGLDRETGALAITDAVRIGQTVQFHVRDAETADEDLRTLLQAGLSKHLPQPGGALLFTCNGRGTRLFEQPHHDARLIRQEAGALPLAGFFAQGELGPVGDQNFIHGFTASVVFFDD